MARNSWAAKLLEMSGKSTKWYKTARNSHKMRPNPLQWLGNGAKCSQNAEIWFKIVTKWLETTGVWGISGDQQNVWG